MAIKEKEENTEIGIQTHRQTDRQTHRRTHVPTK